MAKPNRRILAAPDGQKINDLRFRERQTLRGFLMAADLLAGYGRHTPECPMSWPGAGPHHRCQCGWRRRLREIERLRAAIERRFLDDFNMRPVLKDGAEFGGLIERTDDGSDKKRK
jgi:hypothetical protein